VGSGIARDKLAQAACVVDVLDIAPAAHRAGRGASQRNGYLASALRPTSFRHL
jgi:hypothetical protein